MQIRASPYRFDELSGAYRRVRDISCDISGSDNVNQPHLTSRPCPAAPCRFLADSITLSRVYRDPWRAMWLRVGSTAPRYALSRT